MRITAFVLALLGCSPEKQNDRDSGIGVGNPPGMAELRAVPAAGTGITYTDFEIPVSALYLETCDGVGQVIEQTVDLSLSDQTFVEVPAGVWCALGLLSADPVLLRGEVSNGGQFTFTTPIGRLMVYGQVEVPASDDTEDAPTTQLVLEVGRPEWIDEATLALGPTDAIELGNNCFDDPLCSRLWTAFMHQSALFYDVDGDGQVSEEERNTREAAAGTERGT